MKKEQLSENFAEMSFLKKKKFKFSVEIILADLSDVPFVNAVLFAKVRLLDGGSFCQETDRVPVSNHRICWDKAFRFSCRIGSTQNRVLDKCLCKISIRKEEKGGKAYQKLGYVNVNLAEFAGSGVNGDSKTYLLDGYNSVDQRSDNSRLRINVSMTLMSGDPIFIVPNVQHSVSLQGQVNPVGSKGPSRSPPRSQLPAGAIPTVSGGDRDQQSADGLSVNSGSSGFESLPQNRPKIPSVNEDISPDFIPQHSRGPSSASQGSGYGSAPASANGLHPGPSGAQTINSLDPMQGHSRNSSAGEGVVLPPMVGSLHGTIHGTPGGSLGVNRPRSTGGFVGGHVRRFSNEHSMPGVVGAGGGTRIDSSRPQPDDVVDSLLQAHLGNIEGELDNSGSSGLKLYILEDGSTALGSQGPSAGRFSQVEVVIPSDDR